MAEDGSDEATAKRFVNEIITLCHDLRVPTPRSYGIDEQFWDQKIPLMGAQQALDSGSPANNPIVPTNAEIQALYADI